RRSTPPPGRTGTSTPSSRWICPPPRTSPARPGRPVGHAANWRAPPPDTRAGVQPTPLGAAPGVPPLPCEGAARGRATGLRRGDRCACAHRSPRRFSASGRRSTCAVSAPESGSRDTARCRTGLPWHHGTARCRVEREPTMPDAPLLETGVLVVGAGPTGLMAGLVLHRRGVDSLVIDGKSGPTRESRAIVVQARSMEIYDQLGLAEQVLAGANPAGRLRVAAAPARADRTDRTDGAAGSDRTDGAPGGAGAAAGADFGAARTGWTPFPGAQIFEQSRNEELLARTLAEEGRPVRWGHRLVSFADHPDHVEVLVESPQGPLRIRARYLIGADGASSPVRHQLGLPFDGVTDEATFCVADLHGVDGVPAD